MMRVNQARRWLALAGSAVLLAVGAGHLRVQAQATGAAPTAAPLLTPGAQSRIAACNACHGAQGVSTQPHTPSLAAQPKTFLENRMVLIREGMSPIAAMKGQLEGLSDPDLISLAMFYAALPAPTPRPAEGPARDAARAARGAAVAERALCGSCHVGNYSGRDQSPRLAGQREDYLLASMREFAAGKAVGRDTLMTNALLGLSDGDLMDLAHHLATLGR
jgi:cytochrome c553